ncbi:MAG: hypothetical protein L7R87_04890 [Flavobacteriaceae bacterium]|jgi:hypothetical protein|nr:hypothetical protein [Flavobacteriaceae bacterium]RZP07876.1 MAG: hypothetical protein EVA42_00150 [Flavobacteriales bacterium]
MLKNISYNNQKIIDEINNYVGKPYTILQRLKIGGIGSSKLIVNSADSIIENLLNLDNNLNYCNIEIRPKGIIIHFKSLLEIYGLIVPFYKLKIFKGKANEYSIYIDNFFIKVNANKKTEHDFFKKILRLRASN